MAQPLPNITASYTIVRPKIIAAVLMPETLPGGCRSIPAQVGMPIVFPNVVPSVGKEHPKLGSIATDEGKSPRAIQDDPTLEK